MNRYPADIRRCQHIKANGTQCGSPALREGKFCYHHQECRPERVEVRGDGNEVVGHILFPDFEDATSIQVVVRQVAIMALQKKMDRKTAGLVLYACQIASSNLWQMEEEKPRPVQVVVDTEKVGETPLGMTPWSGNEEGHEPEKIVSSTEEEDEERRRESEFMAEQLTQLMAMMELNNKEIGWCLSADPPWKPESVTEEFHLIRARLAEAIEANRRHCLLQDVMYCREGSTA